MHFAFGLTIDSQLELPELLPGTGSADVTVRFGDVPAELPDVQHRGICFQTASSRVLISLDGVASFDIRNGNEVVIDKAPDVADSTLRLFLLGYCLGTLLHQREMLVLHASVVARGESCIAFAGGSSLGKSTLAAELVNRGYDLVADEVCVIDASGGGAPVVMPGYPALLLWKNTLAKLDLDFEPLGQVRPDIEKYVVPVNSRFCKSPRQLTHMYVLQSCNEDEVSVEPVEGFARFNTFLNNTYREQFLKGMGLSASRQKNVARVAPKVPVSKLSWPQKWDDIDDAIRLLEDEPHLLQFPTLETIPQEVAA